MPDRVLNQPFDVSLSSWSLGLHSPVLRQPFRPPALRHADFEDKYDFHSVFYDCFWSADGKSLQLVGPPLQNLAEDLELRFFALPSNTELKATVVSRVFITHLHLAAPASLKSLRIESSAGTAFIVPQPNLSSLFAGRRVVMTLSQNNELEWIRDWIIYHQRLHGCDAALVYDNNSTRYHISELKACVAEIPGVTGVALDWPFRYGPFDGRLPLTYDLWEGHFCQHGMLEHARYRFLQTARCALNLDIDELVFCPSGESICELTEASPAGHLKFGGKWVETYRSSGTDATAKPLHRDFWHRKAGRTQGCENKYSVVPSRVPDTAQFGVHDIFGHPEGEIDDGIELRHFKAINTNWTVDRPGSLEARTTSSGVPSDLAKDAELAKLLKKAFAGVDREAAPPPFHDRATQIHQIRQKSAQLVRAKRLPEAAREARNALAVAPDWPALHLHHAAILDLQGETAAARRETDVARHLQDETAAGHYERGRYQLHKGDWPGGARLLHRAIRIDRGFAAAYVALARLFWSAGRQRAAEMFIRAGLRHAPSSAALHAGLAEVLSSIHHFEEALDHVDAAIEAEPHNGRLHLFRSFLLRTLDRPREALSVARATLKRQSDNEMCIAQIGNAIDHPFEFGYPDADTMMAHLELIRCLLHMKKLKEAEAQSVAMLARFPNRPQAYEARYLVLGMMGKKRAAKQMLAKAIHLAQRDLARLPPQTLGHYKEKEWHEGRVAYLWYLLLCEGRTEEATVLLEEGVKLYPESHVMAMRLAYLRSTKPGSPELRDIISANLAKFPRDPQIWSEYGRMREADGDVPGAIAAYRRAISFGPGQAWLMSHLAHLLLRQPDTTPETLSEAEALLREALSIDNKHALSHYRIGEVMWRKEQRDDALACWRKAADLAPKEAWLWSHLGGQLVETRQLKEAEAALTRAVEITAKDPLTQFRLGRLHEERGNNAEAVRHMKKALALAPSQPWMWRHLAHLLERMGDPKAATKAHGKADALQ